MNYMQMISITQNTAANLVSRHLRFKNRTKRLLDRDIPRGVHSPVGLFISVDGPEEIAVGIVAELIAVRRGKMI
ncbi:MAG: hypothetical protein ABS920_07890 [Sporosarcina sp.]